MHNSGTDRSQGKRIVNVISKASCGSTSLLMIGRHKRICHIFILIYIIFVKLGQAKNINAFHYVVHACTVRGDRVRFLVPNIYLYDWLLEILRIDQKRILFLCNQHFFYKIALFLQIPETWLRIWVKLTWVPKRKLIILASRVIVHGLLPLRGS